MKLTNALFPGGDHHHHHHHPSSGKTAGLKSFEEKETPRRSQKTVDAATKMNNNPTPVSVMNRTTVSTILSKAAGTKPEKNDFRPKQLKSIASIDYFACCGAGHRLSKLVDAHYLAKQLKFGLRVFFGFCEKQEIYSYFFGPQPLGELQELASVGASSLRHEVVLKVTNDVPGFYKLTREGGSKRKNNRDTNVNNVSDICKCSEDRLEEDFKFFDSLRHRFQAKQKVDDFCKVHLFSTHTVIGMHVRAGNGEIGDFTSKHRGITDNSKWAQSMAEQLLHLSKGWTEPPILFLATDTASMVTTFRSLLDGKMEVVEMSQSRPEQGQGVLFGENFHNLDKGEACLNGWESAFADMMILSHADVVIAARPSSFTQSLPMTMVLSTPTSSRKVLESFCEVNPMATAMQCYKDLMDWCCNGNTSFSLETIQNYDYRRMPDMTYIQSGKLESQLELRPWQPRFCIPTPKNPQRKCLPYEMPDKDKVEEAGRLVGLPPEKTPKQA